MGVRTGDGPGGAARRGGTIERKTDLGASGTAARGLATPSRGSGRVLVRLSAAADGADPIAFLASAPPGSRGFWQRGGRWIAHVGAAGGVEVPPQRTRERFSAVRHAAARLLAGAGEVEGPSPRLYGGFSFGDDGPTPPGRWRPPAARFVLPAMELEGFGETTVLRATARVAPYQTRDEVEEELRRGLEATLRTLTSGAAAERASLRRGADRAPRRLRHLMDSPAWRSAVQRVLGRIRRGEVEKVVLARAVEVEFGEAVAPLAVLERLREANPRAWPFLFEPAEGEAVVGAAPELLVAAGGGRFHTMAVAGTAGRGEAPEEDRRLARSLVESEKDAVEHGIGVLELRERLDGLVSEVREDPAPRVLRLAGMHHLRTDLRGRLSEGTDVLSLVQALHPMAAVCGYPRRTAREIIEGEEPVARGWYAGPVGWLDARGGGVFAPALRSARVRGPVARLHAGAGIVAGSQWAAEWEETGMKLRTVLDALDVPWEA